jgi:hypothetical protein
MIVRSQEIAASPEKGQEENAFETPPSKGRTSQTTQTC